MADKVSTFEQDFGEELDVLAKSGWKPVENDDSVRQLTELMFRIGGEPFRGTILALKHSQLIETDDWVNSVSPWESKVDPRSVREVREKFLGQCLQKAVTSEFLEDAKKRWDQALFTSSLSGFITIGDITVSCLFSPYDQHERDEAGSGAHLGRQNLTYEVWKKTDHGKGISAVRPKINGERFQVVSVPGGKELRGFRTYRVVRDTPYETLEYYAGKFYAISPYLEEEGELEVIEDGGTKVLKVYPHPFMSPQKYYERRHLYRSHQFDGIMVYFSGVEYRSKWSPTAEILLEKEVWEVALYDELWPVRHRPGKSSLAQVAAVSTIQSCLRAGYLVPFFSTLEQETPAFLQEVAVRPRAVQLGAKAFFFLDEKRCAFIREKGKRLDCIGGGVNLGEKPIEAIVREVFEETDVLMLAEDFVYLGVTETESDTGTWRSFVYLAKAPEEMMWKTTVEVYDVGQIQHWNRSDKGRPRQVWVARHLDFLAERFSSTMEAYKFLLERLSQGLDLEVPSAQSLSKSIVLDLGQIFPNCDLKLGGRYQFSKIGSGCHHRYGCGCKLQAIGVLPESMGLTWTGEGGSEVEQFKVFSKVAIEYEAMLLDRKKRTLISSREVSNSNYFSQFPESREGAEILIRDLFGADVHLTAAEYYLRVSKLPVKIGAVRPSRRAAQRFVLRCTTYGILVEQFVPNSGGGKAFYRKI